MSCEQREMANAKNDKKKCKTCMRDRNSVLKQKPDTEQGTVRSHLHMTGKTHPHINVS